MFKYLLFGLLVCCASCGSSTSNAPAAPADLAGFEMTDRGNGISIATKRGTDATTIVEQGALLNGLKNGTWSTYHADNGRVKSITSYIKGKKNGPHLEFTNRGQIELNANYVDDIFDGKYAAYKFGTRPVKEIDYKMGKIHGFYRDYHASNGKLQKEIEYKDGVQHGTFRQYNDEEKLIMEYVYENGEKVSGGVVTE